jgi:MSHA biogenesis protein MshK
MTINTDKNFAHPTPIQLKLLLSVSCGMFLLMMEGEVRAETLKDPTQPPSALSGQMMSENSPSAGPILQSVMIGSQYHAAIINGQKIMLGGKYENATLIKINEREAVLRNADMSTQTLAMDYATVKKTKPTSQTKEVVKTKPSLKQKIE